MPILTLPKILVVDDVPVNRRALTVVVERTGYSFREAADGKEALEMIRQDPPDLVLLDLMMPEMNGEELLEIIGSEFPHTGAIVITAKSDADTITRCRSLGALNYLNKPIDPLRTQIEIENGVRLIYMERMTHSIIRQEAEGTGHPADEVLEGFVLASGTMQAVVNSACESVRLGLPLIVTGESGSGKDCLCLALHKRFNTEGRLMQWTPGSDTRQESSRRSPTLLASQIEEFEHADRKALHALLHQWPGQGLLLMTGNLTQESVDRLSSNDDVEATIDQVPPTWADILLQSGAAHVHIRPLSERPEDLPVLFDHILSDLARKQGRDKPMYSPEIIHQLQRTPPKGNVEGLFQAIAKALEQCDDDYLGPELFM